jgi:hypothetical protein
LPPSTSRAGRGIRAQRRRRQRKRAVAFGAAMAVLVVAIPVLGYVGFNRVFTSTAGRRIDAQNDPTKPSFEVNVTPTPVLLVAQTNADDALTSVTMLVLGPHDNGGAVLFVPPATTSAPKNGTASTLAAAYASGGVPLLNAATADLLGVSFDQVIAITDTQWAQFVTPIAPLNITNPDKLVAIDAKGHQQTQFAAGPLALQAQDVPAYLEARNPQESDLARLARQQLVWQAWLGAVKGSSNANAVPGESSSGFGRYVRGLAQGDVAFSVLPVKAATAPSGDETFTADATTVAAAMAKLVPLPTPAEPGDRVRIRLLSGVGPVDPSALVAAQLVPPSAQLTIIGNADRFDYDTTQIVYSDDEFAAAANALQGTLGVGQVVKSPTPTDSEDVTVVIGKDLVNARGLTISSSS